MGSRPPADVRGAACAAGVKLNEWRLTGDTQAVRNATYESTSPVRHLAELEYRVPVSSSCGRANQSVDQLGQ